MYTKKDLYEAGSKSNEKVFLFHFLGAFSVVRFSGKAFKYFYHSLGIHYVKMPSSLRFRV